MKYFVKRLLPLGLILALSACGLGGGGNRPQPALDAPIHGPAADFPMVLGEPFMVDGVLYTPADTMNYDEVGFVTLDPEGGEAIMAAHRTLPLPSYIEVTSLVTGQTILVRAERRGPMTGRHLIALSPGAVQQLGASEDIPVRVRRVNPPEVERASLRRGDRVPERMATPKSLIEVLKRKLPLDGSQAALAPVPGNEAVANPPQATTSDPAVRKDEAGTAHNTSDPFGQAMAVWDQPETEAKQAATEPEKAAAQDTDRPAAAAPAAPQSRVALSHVVQAGAFADRTNAEKVAKAISGTIDKSGNLYRVRTGPFASRADAEASLAKVKARGYSGARIYSIR